VSPHELEAQEVQLEAHAVFLGDPRHTRARRWCPLQAQVGTTWKERMHMLRKIMFSLGALTVLALAVGAGFKPN
jgi:type II secretory pathway component PulM